MAIGKGTSKIVEEISPFIVMDILEKAQALERSGRSIIHLEVGEPDFDTPAQVKEAALRALREGKTHYTSSLGLKELREVISDYYHTRHGVTVNPDRVIITSGTSPALLLVLYALLDQGDEVILSNPGYACYPNAVKMCGGTPVFVGADEENGFGYDMETVAQAVGPKTKAMIVNSPSNPIGTVLSRESLSQIARLGITIISDEVYHGLVYGEPAHSMLEFTEDAIVVNGFSKLYAMTGWRLGWIVVPDKLVRAIQKLHQNFFICASSVAQHAGIAALTECDEFIEKMVATYDVRRKFIVSKLRQIGFGVPAEPLGAFYVFADAKAFTSNSYEFTFEMLEKAGVAAAPGTDFGLCGKDYIRFSYANSLENIAEAMERLKRYLGA